MANDTNLGDVLDSGNNLLSPMDHETDPANCRMVFVDDNPANGSYRHVFVVDVDRGNGNLINPAVVVDSSGTAVLLTEFSNGAEWSRAYDDQSGTAISLVYFSAHQNISWPNVNNIKIERCTRISQNPDVWTTDDVVFATPPDLGQPGGQIVQRLILNCSYSEVLKDRVLIYCRGIADLNAPGVPAALRPLWDQLVRQFGGNQYDAFMWAAASPQAHQLAAQAIQLPVHWCVDDPTQYPLDDDDQVIPDRYSAGTTRSFTVRPIPDTYSVVYAMSAEAGGMNLVWLDLRRRAPAWVLIKPYTAADLVGKTLVGVGARRVPSLDNIYQPGAAYVLYAVWHDNAGGANGSSYDSFLVYYNYDKVVNRVPYSMQDRDNDYVRYQPPVSVEREVRMDPTEAVELLDDENFVDYDGSDPQNGEQFIVFLGDTGTQNQFLVASALFNVNDPGQTQAPVYSSVASNPRPYSEDLRDAEPLLIQGVVGDQALLYYRYAVGTDYKFGRFDPR